MVSKRFTVACAVVAAVALVGQDDNDHGNEKLAVIVCKVIIVAMATDALVGRLFSLLSSSYSGYEFETTEDDGDGWSFPPDRWIKCNVYCSAPKDKAFGCGVVFRDSTGSWIYGFASRSFNCSTSSAAELKTISTALDIAWNRDFRRLILERDSLMVADVVNNKDGASAHRPYEKKLVESITNKKKNRKWDVQIVHSNREGNKVADWLANLSHGLQVGDQIELEKLPRGCRSCHELMLEDARVAKIKAERSGTASVAGGLYALLTSSSFEQQSTMEACARRVIKEPDDDVHAWSMTPSSQIPNDRVWSMIPSWDDDCAWSMTPSSDDDRAWSMTPSSQILNDRAWSDDDRAWSMAPSSQIPNDRDWSMTPLCDDDRAWSMTPSSQIRWTKPKVGWVKLNVDGSRNHFGRPRSAGCGGVLRDSSGKWLLGFAQKLDPSFEVHETEIEAILKGLELASDMNVEKLVVESDSKSVVSMVKKGLEGKTNHSQFNIINRIRQLRFDPKWEVKVVHVPRKANRVADRLANDARDLPFEYLVKTPYPPANCIPLLQEDAKAC